MTYQHIKTPSDETHIDIAAVEMTYSVQKHLAWMPDAKNISYLGFGKAVVAQM